ncbi:hypothetical protein quinque_006034 [Culex quinquefasciatus]|uniref:uncharacterized protein LOC119767671 n=1 Tax=Culex quinquefasciatus TaxID=7176 RepID=UPI0018E33409|nr:uncharacterized protein LOC119767671 [Culex quinquefasciatus]
MQMKRREIQRVELPELAYFSVARVRTNSPSVTNQPGSNFYKWSSSIPSIIRIFSAPQNSNIYFAVTNKQIFPNGTGFIRKSARTGEPDLASKPIPSDARNRIRF